ncbi:MAG: hypothetical protein Q7S45_00850 [Candidatus Curtissbacteria bacterium]|nr:hypothetical protein [Candidatus Curtissbacteria bacterium]
MTATAHALIGASIAATFTNPIIGIPLAFVSHFLADIVPHWDVGTNHRQKSVFRLRIEATFDVLLGFALSFLLFAKFVEPTYLFVMIIAAQLPDWLGTPYWLFNLKFPPFSWAYYIGHKIQSRMQLPWGLVTQIAIVGLIVATAIWTTPAKLALASLI